MVEKMIKYAYHNNLIEFSQQELKLLEEPFFSELELLKKNNRFTIDVEEILHQNEVISFVKHTRFITIPEHTHKFVEMMYVYQGKVEQFINGHKVNLNQGDICILNPGTFHKIEKSSKDDIIINFVIKPKFLELFLGLFEGANLVCDLIASSMSRTLGDNSYLLFHGHENKELTLIFNKLIEEMYKKSSHSEAKIKILMGRIFLEILEQPEKIHFIKDNNSENNYLITILNTIEKKYSTVTMTMICNETNLSQHKIRKVIKEGTGKSFNQLLQDKRLSKAAELLKTSSISIENIINNVGYENATYFYTLFKNKYKLSLKEYRELIKNK
jgi:AraC-like DNA-binding protein/mannose-6-phosphate isomerase-like protein (cupin superfamily)